MHVWIHYATAGYIAYVATIYRWDDDNVLIIVISKRGEWLSSIPRVSLTGLPDSIV